MPVIERQNQHLRAYLAELAELAVDSLFHSKKIAGDSGVPIVPFTQLH